MRPGPVLTVPSQVLRKIERHPLPPAIVVGTDITGTSLARAYGAHGIIVIGVDEMMRNFTSYSRSYAAVCICDQGFRQQAVVDALEGLAKALPRKAVLALSMDNHVTLLGAHAQHFQDAFFFEQPTSDNVELLMDKQKFSKRAAEMGWPIPRTIDCNSREEIVAASKGLRFPVILKPRFKNPVWNRSSSQKAFRCADATALIDTYTRICDWESQAIVQEWISGGDSDVYFSLHYLAYDGQEIAGFEARKLRQSPTLTGNTSCAVPTESSLVSEMSLEILRGSGAAGFCSVEYKHDRRTNAFLVTEPTIGRVNLQIAVATANGVNIPARAFFHLVDQPYPARERRANPRRVWIHALPDLHTARAHIKSGELTPREYLRTIKGPRYYAAWHWTEYRMMRAALVATVRRAVNFARKRIGKKVRLSV